MVGVCVLKRLINQSEGVGYVGHHAIDIIFGAVFIFFAQSVEITNILVPTKNQINIVRVLKTPIKAKSI